jgi:sigma-E factor negative regulatory protein RseC
MIEESAQVVSVEGEHAWVETERRSSCSSCSAKGCGTGALSKVLGAKTQQIKVRNPVGAAAGDAVIVGIDEAIFLKGSLFVYILPLLLMLAGGLFGEMIAPQWGSSGEGLSLLFGLLGLGGGLFWLRRFNRNVENDPRYTAVILRRCSPDISVTNISFNP